MKQAFVFSVYFFLLFLTFVLSAPNVVFILADDYGWNDIGFHGSSQVDTPVMDSMAEEGVILNNYYVIPLCTPSRASIMTGRHPVRLGLQHSVIIAGQRLGLPLEYKILPQYLNEMGYESHAIGKWHLGFFHRNYTPTYRGFKTFYGYYNGKNDYFDHRNHEGSHQKGQATWWGLDWHLDIEGNLTNVDEDFGLYSTRAIAKRANEVITGHDFAQNPLFLYVAFQSVHSGNNDDPIQVPAETEYKYKNVWNVQRRKFIGAVNEMDSAIGNIKDALQQAGVLHNTIIMFSTDNGGPPNGFDVNWANNFPLRAGKAFFYEGGTRGTSFVYGDLFKARSGDISKELMHVTDWFPTIYEAAGGNVSDLGDIDSFSMLDLLTGKNLTSPRTEVLVNIDPISNAVALKSGRYKYLKNPRDGYSESFDYWFQAPGELPFSNETITPGHKKAQVYCGPLPTAVNLSCFSQISQTVECLFDVENDPCEYYNLIDNPHYENDKNHLLERIKHWESLQVPPLIPKIDPGANPDKFGYIWKPWTDDPDIPTTSQDGWNYYRDEIMLRSM